MSSKSLIMLFMFIGSSIGSYLPTLWGGQVFSFTSVILSAIGGLAGIYVGWRIIE